MRRLFYTLLICCFLVNCNTVKKQQFMGTTQGSYYSITYFDEQNRDFSREFDSIFKEIESTLSLWDENSIIRRVNRNDTTVVLNQIFIDNFKYAMKAAELSDGYFDPTVGPLVQAWGFQFKEGMEMTPEIEDSLKQLVDYRKVKIENNKVIKENPDMTLDFNAVAQGYTTDMIGDFLLSKNVNNFLVDVGGEILARGRKPNGELWKVGIEKPAENKDSVRIVQEIGELKDRSIVTSGNYRKYVERGGKRYSHSLNPKTGYPAENKLLSATIIADNTAWADCLASICMVVGLEKAIEIVSPIPSIGIEAYFIYLDEKGEVKTSKYGEYGVWVEEFPNLFYENN